LAVEYVTFHLPSGESTGVFIGWRKPWDQKKEEMTPERRIGEGDGDGQGSERSPAMRRLGFRWGGERWRSHPFFDWLASNSENISCVAFIKHKNNRKQRTVTVASCQ
jgi:hypothetical protein